jgi:hypothetical protein
MKDMLPTEAMLEAEPALGPVLRDLQAQPVNELTLRQTDHPQYVLALAASSGGALMVPHQEPSVRTTERTGDAIVRVADLVQDARSRRCRLHPFLPCGRTAPAIRGRTPSRPR